MKSYFKLITLVIMVVLTISLFGFVGNLLGLFSFAFFAPKVEQVHYNTFKESQSYNDGMLRDLQNLKLEYLRGTPEQKAALQALVIISQFPLK